MTDWQPFVEKCARIADPWPGYSIDENSSEQDKAIVKVRKEIAEHIRMIQPPERAAENQWDARFHPWPGWPNNKPWCSRCTFKPADDYERLSEWLVEQMHMYAMSVKTESHQTGEGYNNLVRMTAHELRMVGRKGIRGSLKAAKATTS